MDQFIQQFNELGVADISCENFFFFVRGGPLAFSKLNFKDNLEKAVKALSIL